MLVAHIREKDYERQLVTEHLKAVSKLGREYGQPLGMGALVELSGLLHDMGKLTKKFTEYLESVVIGKQKVKTKINHSSAGAVFLYKNFYNTNLVTENDFFQNMAIEIICMNILSHHAGLYDFLTMDRTTSDFIRRVSQEDLPNYEEVLQEWKRTGLDIKVEGLVKEAGLEVKQIIESIQGDEEHKKFSLIYFSFIQKLSFSCLIDADRTDTRRFEEDDQSPLQHNSKEIFEKAYSNIMQQIKEWNIAPENMSKLNRLRSMMSDKCDEVAGKESGIYKLSIPTGGGKTFASLRYALKHAIKHNKKRIIYIVPYTTILEQNAQEVRRFFDDEPHVLEHHANIIDDQSLDHYSDYYEMPNHKKLQLGRDNWDHPVIFTTMVQYLDTFFAKGTRKSRRLHNLTDAVIVIDEVQTVPVKHLDLFNSTVNFLTKIGKSSVLLCTATQPAVEYMKYPILLNDDAEMIDNLPQVAKEFERVKFHNYVTRAGWSTEQLSDFIIEKTIKHRTILIILNTKRAVLDLYQSLKNLESHHIFHLSTSMCPAHRKEKLREIKEKLNNQPVICISTQLIEAGVDISFEAVIRSLAGLDSIAQAAGRCNREGEAEFGDVYLVKSAVESLTHLKEIKVGIKTVLDYVLTENNHIENLLSPEMIERYFYYYYSFFKNNNFVPKNLERQLIEHLNNPSRFYGETKTVMQTMYRTVEQNFQAIEQSSKAIIVPHGARGKELIVDLNEEQSLEKLNQLMKEAQQYVVNIFDYQLQVLAQAGHLDTLYNDTLYVLHEDAYTEEYGLSVFGEGVLGDLIM
ncbi:CRISPR-associated helicase Cas3' [Ornithinibacillus sp. 4-3]|uniref:CRISPR-associated helicase Cas3 n=1 Tax=Ornithinibacillus sp. 4-3 TaxID=3231488 RepID=A0AB39HMV2_9BACI